MRIPNRLMTSSELVKSPEKIMTPDEKQKWRDIFADMRLNSYSTMYALHKVAQHWVENESIIERAAEEEADLNGPKWTPDYDDQDSMGEFYAERDLARDMHDHIMIPMHRYSCIVMLYTTVERELRRLIENLEKERGPQKLHVKDMKANSYLAKVAKHVKDFHGVKFSNCPQYESLCDLQKIRDCIVHCHGEVSLSRDKEDLIRLWRGSKRRNSFAAPPTRDIYIGAECIKQFLIETWSFFVWVFSGLNWKIAAHWQGNKLEKTFEKLKNVRGIT
jgi:hypothetical protein